MLPKLDLKKSSEEPDLQKHVVLSCDDDCVHRLIPDNHDYQASYEEQMKASREGVNYKYRPGIRDAEIRMAGSETQQERRLRILNQIEVGKRMRAARHAGEEN